jgi:type VI protein secretion system component Hcp
MKPFGSDERSGTAMKFRIDGQWRWLVALGGILVPGIVFGAFSVPHTFEPGTPIKASEMNANFEALAAKIDAQANPSTAPAIGTLTLDGVASALPITKFSQSINVPWAVGAGAGKPTFSEIVVQRLAGVSTPDMNRAATTGEIVPTVSIQLGSLTVDLEDVRVTGVSIVNARGQLPQEAVSLLFRAITWSWDDGVNPVTEATFDVPLSTGSGPAVDSFTFGRFPASVTPDASYTPIAGYEHHLACSPPATNCKVGHGPVVVGKLVAGDTVAGIGALVNAKPVGLLLDAFAEDATISSSIELEQALITSWSVSTAEDGTLNESVSFSYQRIYWRAGMTEHGWNVATSTSL